MNEYHVTFYGNRTPANIQREVVKAENPESLRRMYQDTNCGIIEIKETESSIDSRMKLEYGANWQADADKVHDLIHPVEEVKSQYECENCCEGAKVDTSEYIMNEYRKCPCCNGNWQDCQNCKPVDEMEYRKSQLPKNVIASETWLKRNTHASPAEKENARIQGEMLKRLGG